MSILSPRYGEVWLADLDPIVGHEQAGVRPVLIVSNDQLNAGYSGLLLIIPLTGKDRNIRSHVRIDPPEGGLEKTSFALCEQLRSISKARLRSSSAFGRVKPQTAAQVKTIISVLLDM